MKKKDKSTQNSFLHLILQIILLTLMILYQKLLRVYNFLHLHGEQKENPQIRVLIICVQWRQGIKRASSAVRHTRCDLRCGGAGGVTTGTSGGGICRARLRQASAGWNARSPGLPQCP